MDAAAGAPSEASAAGPRDRHADRRQRRARRRHAARVLHASVPARRPGAGQQHAVLRLGGADPRPHRPRAGGVLRALGLPHRAAVHARLRHRHAQAAACAPTCATACCASCRPSTSSRSSCCCASASTARWTSGAREHEQRAQVLGQFLFVQGQTGGPGVGADRPGLVDRRRGRLLHPHPDRGYWVAIALRAAAAHARAARGVRDRGRRRRDVLSIALRAHDQYRFAWLTSPPAIMYVFMPGVAIALVEPLLAARLRDRARLPAASPGARSRCSALLAVVYAASDYDPRQTPIHHALGQRALIAALCMRPADRRPARPAARHRQGAAPVRQPASCSGWASARTRSTSPTSGCSTRSTTRSAAARASATRVVDHGRDRAAGHDRDRRALLPLRRAAVPRAQAQGRRGRATVPAGRVRRPTRTRVPAPAQNAASDDRLGCAPWPGSRGSRSSPRFSSPLWRWRRAAATATRRIAYIRELTAAQTQLSDAGRSASRPTRRRPARRARIAARSIASPSAIADTITALRAIVPAEGRRRRAQGVRRRVRDLARRRAALHARDQEPDAQRGSARPAPDRRRQPDVQPVAAHRPAPTSTRSWPS